MIELRFRFDAALRESVQPGSRRVTARRPYLLLAWLDIGVRLAEVARLETAPEAIAQHRSYYLDVVKADPEDWHRIEPVYGQIKWAWTAAPDDEQLGTFQWALNTYQLRQGLWDDLVNWLQRVLALAQAQGWQAEEGRLRNNLGNVYATQGRWDDAIALYEESLRIRRALGDRSGISQSTMGLGNVYNKQGQWDDAIALYQESLNLQRALGDRSGISQSIMGLGSVYDKQGRWAAAVTLYHESLNLQRALGDTHGEGTALMNLGRAYDKLETSHQAMLLWQEALTKLHPSSPEYKQLAAWLQQQASQA